MEVRLGTQAVVSPFEVSEQDKIQPLVIVIPVQFVTSSVAAVVMEFVRKVREEKDEASFKFFPRSLHCVFVSIGKHTFMNLFGQIHIKKIPVLFCRALHSAATK